MCVFHAQEPSCAGCTRFPTDLYSRNSLSPSLLWFNHGGYRFSSEIVGMLFPYLVSRSTNERKQRNSMGTVLWKWNFIYPIVRNSLILIPCSNPRYSRLNNQKNIPSLISPKPDDAVFLHPIETPSNRRLYRGGFTWKTEIPCTLVQRGHPWPS